MEEGRILDTSRYRDSKRALRSRLVFKGYISALHSRLDDRIESYVVLLGAVVLPLMDVLAPGVGQ